MHCWQCEVCREWATASAAWVEAMRQQLAIFHAEKRGLSNLRIQIAYPQHPHMACFGRAAIAKWLQAR